MNEQEGYGSSLPTYYSLANGEMNAGYSFRGYNPAPSTAAANDIPKKGAIFSDPAMNLSSSSGDDCTFLVSKTENYEPYSAQPVQPISAMPLKAALDQMQHRKTSPKQNLATSSIANYLPMNGALFTDMSITHNVASFNGSTLPRKASTFTDETANMLSLIQI